MIKTTSKVKDILQKIQNKYPDVSGASRFENNFMSFDSSSQLAPRSQTANTGYQSHSNRMSSLNAIGRSSITNNITNQYNEKGLNNMQNNINKMSPYRKNKSQQGISSITQINFGNSKNNNGSTSLQSTRQKSQEYSKYIENLEKKLNELNGGKSSDKKNMNTAYKQADIFKKKSTRKKLKMCRQFHLTGLCRNGQNCPLAHNFQELDIQYIPKVWSKHFDQHKKSNQYLNGLKYNITDRENLQQEQDENNENEVKEKSENSQDDEDQSENEDKYSQSTEKIDQETTSNNNISQKHKTKQQVEDSQLQTKSFTKEVDITQTLNNTNKKQDMSSIMKKNQFSIHFNKTGYSTTMMRSKRFPEIENYIVDINKIINQRGRSILLEAVLSGQKEIVKELLLKGANPCITDWSGNDCILYSIKKNSEDILRYLLDYSQFTIDLNKQFNTNKITYLVYAAQNGLTNIIIILLASGANPNITDQFSRTPLTFAVKNNDIDTIQALCENGAQGTIVDDYNKTPVDYAFDKKQLDIVTYLFKKGGVFSDQKKNRKVMFFAAENNLVDLIHEMIQRNNPITDKDHHGNNLLMLLYKNRHFDNILKVIEDFNLVSQICDKNNDGDCVLTLTGKESNDMLAKQLIQRYSNSININEGKTCLIHACEYGLDDLVELLLLKGADPNIYDRNWETPLLLSVKNDHLMCVRTLLQYNKGIDILWKDQYQNTARSCSKSNSIKNLISKFMVENDKMSDSLIKELEDEEFNLKQYFDQSNNNNNKRGSTLYVSFQKKNYRIKKQAK